MAQEVFKACFSQQQRVNLIQPSPGNTQISVFRNHLLVWNNGWNLKTLKYLSSNLCLNMCKVKLLNQTATHKKKKHLQLTYS